MKILLDEQVPVPVLDPLQRMLQPTHKIDHVSTIKWTQKLDRHLIPDLKERGYAALVTADLRQLENPDEVTLIYKTKIHHIRYNQHGKGIHKTASAIATVVAGLPSVVAALEEAPGQRLVSLKLVRSGATQFDMVDPSRTPPSVYWPSRKTVGINRPPRR